MRLAKICRPNAKGAFPRERLFQAFDAMRANPLVYINGPAGSGKTMLVSSYIEARSLAHLWYRIDEGDSDIGTFFHYLSLLVKQSTGARKTLPPFSPEAFSSFHTFALRFFENLYLRMKFPFVMVLDNYQLLEPSSPTHEIIRIAADVLPDGCSIGLISRSAAPPQLSVLKASKKIGFINWEDLRFTEEESVALLRHVDGDEFDEGQARRYDAIAGGWAAGLILMARGGGGDPVEHHVMDEPAVQEIFNYFATEVFSGLRPELQEFLLKTSFLPSMTAETALDLTGLQHSREILSELVQGNYFVENYFREKRSYQYHPLFHDFLRSTVYSRLNREEIRDVLRHVAHALIEAGRFEEALPPLREAEDWQTVVSLVLTNAPSLVKQGRFQTLQEAIAAIPEAVRDSVPWMGYWLGVCNLPFDPTESMKLFERAFFEFEKQNDRTGQLLAWCGAIDSAHLEAFQNFRRVSSTVMDRWIAWLEKDVEGGAGFPSEMVEAHVATSMTGALLVRRPQDPNIRQWSRRALALARSLGDEMLITRAFGYSIGLSNILGDYADTFTLFEEMDRTVTPGTGPFDTGNEVNRAVLYNQSRDGADLALAAVNKGLKISEDTGICFWVPMLLAQGAFACFNKGEQREAGRFIDRMKDHLKGAPILVGCQYYQMAALRSCIDGDIATAIRHCEEQLRLALDVECPWITAASRLHLAIVLSEAGELRRAHEQLEVFPLLPDFSPILHYTYLLTKTSLELKEGNQDRAIEYLREGLALARKKGYVSMFYWWDPAFMTRLYSMALRHGIETGYVGAIVKARDLFPEEMPLDTPDWPWPFKVYTLGGFRLLKDDTPIPFEGRSRQRPLTLLKSILALGGLQVPEHTLTESLWPDALGDAAHSAYTTTLSRLRRLLGSDRAVEVQGHKVSLNRRYFWVDAWLFEDLCRKIDALRKKGDREGMVQRMEEAAELYGGPFLSADEEFWTISTRESLQSRFLKLVEGLGEELENDGDLAKAVECYEKALRTDDLIEEFYQRLMKCYENEGRHAEALNTYFRCKKTLHGRLGVTPSGKTQAVYEALKRNQ